MKPAGNPDPTTPIILVIVVLLLYFLPTIVAVVRGKSNMISISIVNVVFGWTVLGWIIALVWACSVQAVDQLPAAPFERVEAAPGAARLCPHCGKYSPPAQKFCGQCGAAFST